MSNEYQEFHVRADFIDKLFFALGWRRSSDPYHQEMKFETPERKARGRADYAFFVAPHYKRVRFFVEAKRPQANIATPDNCFQAIRYSWPKDLPIAVLTDFQNIHLIDSRFRPNIDSATSRIVHSWHCSDFEDREKFEKLYWLLSREAVGNGSIDWFAENELPVPQLAARQYSLFAGEAREFDDHFLQQLDDWRKSLATAFKRANNHLTGEQLTETVQRTLDRLIFIRFLEDKAIEPEEIIAKFGQKNKTHWQDFVSVSRRLDQQYNGIVFKPHSVLDDKSFEPDSMVFAEICDSLTDQHSPYNFDSIPVEILGRIYERFLGKVVQSNSRSVDVVEKENVRKAGGVFYTPDYIVAYMVDQSLGGLVRNRKPDEIMKIRLIDTACGSGSFLIGAFGYLLDSIAAYYGKYPREAKKNTLKTDADGTIHLSLRLKREILVNCVYGIDIDPQAVEVAQLSLYLKLMEEETTYSAHQQQLEIGAALLPSLSANIVVGNSLVNPEGGDLFSIQRLRETKAIDYKSEFPQIFKSGGFDLVIGNPPYIKEYTNRDAFEHIRTSQYYEGKMDIWYMFACAAIDILRENSGVLAYIATNNWVTNSGAKKLRTKITHDARIEQLIDFGSFMVFRDASVQTMILIAKRNGEPNQYKFDYRRLLGKKPALSDALALLEKRDEPNIEYLVASFDRNRSGASPLTFSDSSVEAVLQKIASKRNFELNPTQEVAQGIVPNPDVVSTRSLERIPGSRRQSEGIHVGNGVFVVDADYFSPATKEEESFLKPLYEPSGVECYALNTVAQKKIIYSTRGNSTSLTLPQRLLSHLERYREIMEERRENRMGRIEFFQLHWPREERFFASGPKILAVRKCAVPTFTYTDEEAYVMMSFNIIQSSRVNLKFLTGLLNSRLVRFWLSHKGKMQGNNFQVDKEPLLDVPLCVPNQSAQKPIRNLVERIIDCKKQVSQAGTDAEKERLLRLILQCQNQIDESVEELYGLSSEDKEVLGSLAL